MALHKLLILFGALLMGAGMVVWIAPKVPGLDRLGKLPGDIHIEKGNSSFSFPWVTCLLISLIISLILSLFHGLQK